jgi:POT family proton-dependent oligopeptide transporter
MNQNTNDDFKTNVLGHPAGLFVFFTEMERFSYYGMRAFIVLLTSSLAKGWAWSIEDALALYGTYNYCLFTPVIGVC